MGTEVTARDDSVRTNERPGSMENVLMAVEVTVISEGVWLPSGALEERERLPVGLGKLMVGPTEVEGGKELMGAESL